MPRPADSFLESAAWRRPCSARTASWNSPSSRSDTVRASMRKPCTYANECWSRRDALPLGWVVNPGRGCGRLRRARSNRLVLRLQFGNDLIQSFMKLSDELVAQLLLDTPVDVIDQRGHPAGERAAARGQRYAHAALIVRQTLAAY